MAAHIPVKDTAGNLRNYTTPRDAYLGGYSLADFERSR